MSTPIIIWQTFAQNHFVKQNMAVVTTSQKAKSITKLINTLPPLAKLAAEAFISLLSQR